MSKDQNTNPGLLGHSDKCQSKLGPYACDCGFLPYPRTEVIPEVQATPSVQDYTDETGQFTAVTKRNARFLLPLKWPDARLEELAQRRASYDSHDVVTLAAEVLRWRGQDMGQPSPECEHQLNDQHIVMCRVAAHMGAAAVASWCTICGAIGYEGRWTKPMPHFARPVQDMANPSPVEPARLDEDRTAKPKTEIVGHFPAGKKNFYHNAERLEVRPTPEGPANIFCPLTGFTHSGAMAGEGCDGCDEQHRYLVDKHIGPRASSGDGVRAVPDGFFVVSGGERPTSDPMDACEHCGDVPCSHFKGLVDHLDEQIHTARREALEEAAGECDAHAKWASDPGRMEPAERKAVVGAMRCVAAILRRGGQSECDVKEKL